MRERLQTTDGDEPQEPSRDSAHTFGDKPAPPPPPPKKRKKRTYGKNAAIGVGQSIVLLCSFAGATLGGIVLHANAPSFRRTAASIGNEIIGNIFEGKIVVTNVRSLSLGRYASITIEKAEVLDPEGKRVILAESIDGTIDLYRLLDSVAAGKGPVVDLSRSNIANSEVVLDVDPKTKAPKIALTFQPKKKPDGTMPPPPTVPELGPPKEPTVIIPKVLLKKAHVHGDLVPPSLDADGLDLDASVSVENAQAHIELKSGTATSRSPRAPNQKCDVTGKVHGTIDVALKTATVVLNADLLEGNCAGAVPVVAHATMNKDELDATVDIASVDPKAMASVFGEGTLPIKKNLEVHARVHGKLPTLLIDAKGKLGDATVVTANGEIDLREGRAFKLDVDASHVDASAFGAEGVTTDISGKAHAEGALGTSGGPIGTFKVTTTEGTAADQKIPAAVIDGSFDPQTVKATFRAKETGLDASGSASLDLPTKIVKFDVQGRSDSLRSIARAQNVASGSATARVRGTIDLNQKTIAATASASGDGVAVADGTASAKHVNANGKISGPLTAPLIELTFSGDDIKVQTAKPEKDKAAPAPLVYPHAKGGARIAIGGGGAPRILDASLDVDSPTGSKDSISASAKGIHVKDGNIEARGLTINGLGEPLELDAQIGNGQWSIRAKSAGIDFHRAATLTGIKQLKLAPEGTRAELDIDVRQTTAGADGHVDVVVRSEKGAALGSGALSLEAHAKIDRGKLIGNAKLVAEGLGQVEITRAELDMPNGRLDARTLQRTTGVVELRGAVDLSQGAALLLGEYVERASGIASFEARIERGDPDALPAIRGTVKTEGLEVAILRGDPPIDSTLVSGIDLMAHVAWDGRTEDAEVSLLSWDKHGVLGSAGAKSKVPLAAWATGAKKIDGASIGVLDIDAIVNVPERDLSALPQILKVFDLKGKVDGRVQVAGTIAHPKLMVTGKANGLEEENPPPHSGPSFEPLDGTLEARWDGEHASVSVALDER